MRLTRKDFTALKLGADLAQAQRVLNGLDHLENALEVRPFLAGAIGLALLVWGSLALQSVYDAPGDLTMQKQYQSFASND